MDVVGFIAITIGLILIASRKRPTGLSIAGYDILKEEGRDFRAGIPLIAVGLLLFLAHKRMVGSGTELAATATTPTESCTSRGVSEICRCPDGRTSVSFCKNDGTKSPCICPQEQRGIVTRHAPVATTAGMQLREHVQALRALEWPWSPSTETCTLLIHNQGVRHGADCEWSPSPETSVTLTSSHIDGPRSSRTDLRAHLEGTEASLVTSVRHGSEFGDSSQISVFLRNRMDGLAHVSMRATRWVDEDLTMLRQRDLLLAWDADRNVPLAVGYWETLDPSEDGPGWTVATLPLPPSELLTTTQGDNCAIQVNLPINQPVYGPATRLDLQIGEQILHSPSTFRSPTNSTALPFVITSQFMVNESCSSLSNVAIATRVRFGVLPEDFGNAANRAEGRGVEAKPPPTQHPRVGEPSVGRGTTGERYRCVYACEEEREPSSATRNMCARYAGWSSIDTFRRMGCDVWARECAEICGCDFNGVSTRCADSP